MFLTVQYTTLSWQFCWTICEQLWGWGCAEYVCIAGREFHKNLTPGARRAHFPRLPCSVAPLPAKDWPGFLRNCSINPLKLTHQYLEKFFCRRAPSSAVAERLDNFWLFLSPQPFYVVYPPPIGFWCSQNLLIHCPQRVLPGPNLGGTQGGFPTSPLHCGTPPRQGLTKFLQKLFKILWNWLTST